jgi:hypothetical protein
VNGPPVNGHSGDGGNGGRLYLGWQYATPASDPGPPPRRPAPSGAPPSPDGWLAAQRREEAVITRPARRTLTSAALLALVLAAAVAAGQLPVTVAAPAIAACLAATGLSGYSIWRGERALRRRADAELLRARRLDADQRARLRRAQAEHVRAADQWQERRSAFLGQKRWYAVPVPDGIDRVDVAGGTLAGWSAMLTMAAAYRLATDGEVTVVDLSGGAVAADLADLYAAADAVPPAVWVLPDDLPRLDLAASLPPGDLADVLALSASAAEEHGSARDLAIDTAILDRVIEVLGRDGAAPVQVRRVAAGLRALAQVGDPRADLAAGLLSEREAGELSALFGQGVTDRVVLERALGMEAQLRRLASVGTSPVRLPRGRLRIVAVDRRASQQAATTLGSFVVTALTAVLGQAPAATGATSWRHTLFLLGAERLRADVLDRFTDACEVSRCGLVLAYRSLPPHVRQRIGRGNAAVAFMRLGNSDDAKAASEQIGMSHRFVVSQLTETVGTSVTDTLGGSYTSTVGDSASTAVSASTNDSRSTGTGRTSPSGGGVLPLRGGGSRSSQAGASWGTSESTSFTAGISTSTAWGVSTSRAAGDSESLARSLQRSRELIVEPSELQRLPVTAMIVSYGAGAGRRVLLADANPAIGALPVATLAPLADPAAAPSSLGAATPLASQASGVPLPRAVHRDGRNPQALPHRCRDQACAALFRHALVQPEAGDLAAADEDGAGPRRAVPPDDVVPGGEGGEDGGVHGAARRLPPPDDVVGARVLAVRLIRGRLLRGRQGYLDLRLVPVGSGVDDQRTGVTANVEEQVVVAARGMLVGNRVVHCLSSFSRSAARARAGRGRRCRGLASWTGWCTRSAAPQGTGRCSGTGCPGPPG